MDRNYSGQKSVFIGNFWPFSSIFNGKRVKNRQKNDPKRVALWTLSRSRPGGVNINIARRELHNNWVNIDMMGKRGRR